MASEEKKQPSSIEDAVKDEDSINVQPDSTFISKKSKKNYFGENPFYKNPMIQKYLIGGLVLVVIIILAVVLYKPPYYKTLTVKNTGYSYSFKFASDATIKNISTINQPIGYNLTKTNKLDVVIYKSNITGDCHKLYSYLSVYFTSNIQGVNYSTCADATKTDLLTFFKYDGAWHLMEISSTNQKTQVDVNSAKTIVSSVKVTKAS
jgi:hypothetical protein